MINKTTIPPDSSFDSDKVFIRLLLSIKARLESGELSAGDKLPSERALATEMGISRPTVREGLRAMELLGLVKSVQGGGNYLSEELNNCLVAPFSLMFSLVGGSVRDAQDLRVAIEVEAATLAAERCGKTDARELQKLASRFSGESDCVTRAALDRQIHYHIAELSENPLIISVFNATSKLIDSIIYTISNSIAGDSENIGLINKQHRNIIDAITSGDKAAAALEMKCHMDTIGNFIKSL